MRGAGPPATSMPHPPVPERTNDTSAPVRKRPSSTRALCCPNAAGPESDGTNRKQATTTSDSQVSLIVRLVKMGEFSYICLSLQSKEGWFPSVVAIWSGVIGRRPNPCPAASTRVSVGPLAVCEAGPVVCPKWHGRQSGLVIECCRRIRLPRISDRFGILYGAGRDNHDVAKHVSVRP